MKEFKFYGQQLNLFSMQKDKKKQSKTDVDSQIDFKARLDKKLMYAFESPEPTIDLSDCNLEDVPPNIFSPIKVSRKHILNLQNNRLSGLSNGGNLEDLKLIKILDLSFNNFYKLPSNLDVLRSLEVLDASRNHLTELPNSIGNLFHLVWLNLSNNELKNLPETIGNLRKLEVLNLRLNPQLKYIPPSVSKLQSLLQFDIDPTVVYPPREVYKQGIPAMLAFLAKDFQDDVPSTSGKSKIRIQHNKEDDWQDLEEQLKQHELQKEEKQKQLMELEKQILNTHKQEVELQQHLKERRQKLVEEMQVQQKALDEDLSRLQEKKDAERVVFLESLVSEEKKANEVVNKIIQLNKKKQIQSMDIWEEERKQEEAQLLNFVANNKTLERKKILVSMNEVMKSEIDFLNKAASSKKAISIQKIAAEVSDIDEELQKVFKKSEKNQKKLIDTIQKNEELQKSAVATLLEKSDASSWALTQEILLVQQQIAELTRIEVAKKKAESEIQVEELNQNRLALTNILIQLFEKKLERRKHLIDTLRKLENARENFKDSDTFWMEQYDKLLSSKSHEMVQYLQSLHPELTKEFFYNGVLHYLPYFKNIANSNEKLRNLDGNALLRIGIKVPEDRTAIMTAVENYLLYLHEEEAAEEHAKDSKTKPKESEIKITKSQIVSTPECVVCLEAKPKVLFVSCGHICCCKKCYLSISLCPLCRKTIDKVYDIEES